ncbi:MAG: HD domain-containing protein [Anaerolineae bacterium]
MSPEAALVFLREALCLKRVPRTGWLLRGLSDVESVAEHTWGVALAVLVLAKGVEESLDLEKALTIALLHDLPERVLSDIPSPAVRHLRPRAKRRAEVSILTEMLSAMPEADRLRDWWLEFEESSTLEGQLVRDADRLEMLLQAHLYEEGRGCRLEDFWENQEGKSFSFPFSQAVYEALVEARARESH